MRKVGYNVNQVAKALVSVYGKKRSQIEAYMKAAGYKTKEYKAAVSAALRKADSGARSGIQLALHQALSKSKHHAGVLEARGTMTTDCQIIYLSDRAITRGAGKPVKNGQADRCLDEVDQAA